MAAILSSLKGDKLKFLMGNAMQLTVEAAWMLYVLGNLARREQPDVAGQIAVRGSSSEEEDEF